MDLKQLDSIDTNNLEEVKKLQRFLKTRGFYSGPEDGKWGGGTTEGAKQLRADLKEADERSTRKTEAEAEGKKAENDPTARATKMATEFGPWLGGALLGYGSSRYVGGKFDKRDAAQKDAGSRLAKALDVNPEASGQGLRRMDTARKVGAGKQFLGPAAWLGAGAFTSDVVAPRFKDDPETQKYINLAATTENAAGTTMAAKQLIDLATRGDPIDPEDRARIVSRTMPPAQGALSRALQGQTIDAVAELPRTALPAPAASAAAPEAAPAETPPSKIQNSERMIKAAREAGATGPLTKATAAEFLARNVTDANRGAVAKALGVNNGPNLASRLSSTIGTMASKRGASSVVLPLAAGGLAYEMTRNQAQAADGSGGAGSPIAAGATAAGAVGLSQALASRFPGLVQALGTAGNVAGTAAAAHQNAGQAMAFRDAQPPEQQASPFGQMMPHAMPLAMRGAQDLEAITTAPSRLSAALSRELGPRNEPPSNTEVAQPGFLGPDAIPTGAPLPQPDSTYGRAGPLMSAAALELPQNVDPNATAQADIASGMEGQQQANPFSPNVQGRLDRMIKLGARPEQIAAFLNQTAAR